MVNSALHLPLPFSIIFLPFENFSLTWFINYLFQLVWSMLGVLLTIIYFMFTLAFLNHSCWQVDIILSVVKRMSSTLVESEGFAELTLARSLVQKRLKSVYKRTVQLLKWHEHIQKIMKFSFFVEFIFLSIILCLSITSLVDDPFGSMLIIVLIAICTSQFFLYCFMGSRVMSKVNELAAALYDVNWHLMRPKQRKDLQLILVMVQNFQPYNGIFKDINLETFQKVRIKFRVNI